MGKRSGFPGGMMPGNMNNLMKQAQKMQKQMQEQQAAMAEKAEEIENKIFEATAGGGAVTVKVNGKKELIELILDKDAVDPDDVEMLQDMIVAAVNSAMSQVDKAQEELAQGLQGGLGGLGALGGMDLSGFGL